MNNIMVGVGGFAYSEEEGSVIKTMALGSCVAIAVTSESPKVAFLAHVALPDSKTLKARAKKLPGYFADSAVEELLKKFKTLGINKKSKIIVKIAGGANVIDPGNVFNIGKRNILAVKKCLWKYKIPIKSEDVGGNISRTVWLEFDTGKYIASNPIKGQWEI